MRKNITSIFFGAVGAAFLLVNDGLAGTLTITSGPDFDPPGFFTNNTIVAEQVNLSLIRLYGDATITQPDNSSTPVTAEIGGTFEANANDLYSYAYDFTINLDSASPVSYSLQLFVDIGFGEQMVLEETGAIQQGSHAYSGGDFGAVGADISGTFRAVLRLDYDAPQQNDFLQISIPDNSIKFQLAPTAIPEPSTVVFVGLGLGALVIRLRRQRAARLA